MTRLSTSSADPRLDAFVDRVLAEGAAHHRDFAWRRTRDPYAVLVSEVMLQQTQAGRVVPYFDAWMEQFPSLEALAAAPLEIVLSTWQGLGYNRRPLALKRLAEQLVAEAGDRPAALPEDHAALLALPGVGPATAAGVIAFAFDRHGVYLETNVRTVVLHELFADADAVPDREIVPLVEGAALVAAAKSVSARAWNLALLDYGAHLKRTLPNPSRRSAHHTRQSRFEGSRRQLRARLLRLVMQSPGGTPEEYAESLQRGAVSGTAAEPVDDLLGELAREGFLRREGDRFHIA